MRKLSLNIIKEEHKRSNVKVADGKAKHNPDVLNQSIDKVINSSAFSLLKSASTLREKRKGEPGKESRQRNQGQTCANRSLHMIYSNKP